MKIIFKIAKTELQKLFFSPVAWLILVIYTFQTGLMFTSVFGGSVKNKALGYNLWDLTHTIYGGQFGLFSFLPASEARPSPPTRRMKDGGTGS